MRGAAGAAGRALLAGAVRYGGMCHRRGLPVMCAGIAVGCRCLGTCGVVVGPREAGTKISR